MPFFSAVTLLLPLREPPRKFLSNGVVFLGVKQSTRLGSLLCRALKLLLLLLVTCFTKLPLSEFSPTSGNVPCHQNPVRSATEHYRHCLDAWARQKNDE
jgi:hypothetical protein